MHQSGWKQTPGKWIKTSQNCGTSKKRLNLQHPPKIGPIVGFIDNLPIAKHTSKNQLWAYWLLGHFQIHLNWSFSFGRLLVMDHDVFLSNVYECCDASNKSRANFISGSCSIIYIFFFFFFFYYLRSFILFCSVSFEERHFIAHSICLQALCFSSSWIHFPSLSFIFFFLLNDIAFLLGPFRWRW